MKDEGRMMNKRQKSAERRTKCEEQSAKGESRRTPSLDASSFFMLHAPLTCPLSFVLRPFCVVLACAFVLASTGCIRSRVHITSEPDGAEVIWRGQPYGATPITIPFNWYWYYSIALEKPGYDRLETLERFRTPPWFLMPLDLVMELVPIPIPDNRDRHYVLQPKAAAAPAPEGPLPAGAGQIER
jgi:hypothetical protein